MDIAAPATAAALRPRIGWLCQSLRFAAVVYPIWIFVLLALHWSNADEVTRAYSHWLKTTLIEVPASQRAVGFALQMAPFAFTVVACGNLWRLFSGFLAGDVFTLAAALTLRRLAVYGLAAVAIDLASRPLLAIVASLHMAPGARHVAFFLMSNDLLNLMFLGGLLALAQVFKVAAELAEDHAAIV